MTTVKIIGDVHGRFNQYEKLITGVEHSRQVGDFGVGFFKWDLHDMVIVPLANPPYDIIMKGDHKFIRGNHDNPIVSRQQRYYIPDGYYEVIDNEKILYVGGALSIDKLWRKQGLDWWADEELSYSDLQNIIDKAKEEQPTVIISHDCPEFVAKNMEFVSGRQKLDINSRTRYALEMIYEFCKPKLHIFGHWHYSYSNIINKTKFICLDELEYVDIDFNTIGKLK